MINDRLNFLVNGRRCDENLGTAGLSPFCIILVFIIWLELASMEDGMDLQMMRHVQLKRNLANLGSDFKWPLVASNQVD